MVDCYDPTTLYAYAGISFFLGFGVATLMIVWWASRD